MDIESYTDDEIEMLPYEDDALENLSQQTDDLTQIQLPQGEQGHTTPKTESKSAGSSSKVGKRQKLNAYHIFTLQNWTEDHITKLREVVNPESDDTTHPNGIFFAKEIAPTTGTPHLQGLIYFKKRIRPSALSAWFKRTLGVFCRNEVCGAPKAHQAYIRGGGIFMNWETREKKFKPANNPEDIYLFGQMTFEKATLNTWYKAVTTSTAFNVEDIDHPFKVLPGYMKRAIEIVDREAEKVTHKEHRDYYTKDFVPNTFQQLIMHEIDQLPARRVLWISDPEGHHGKSDIGTYFYHTKGQEVMYTPAASSANIAYQLKSYHKLVFLDLARAAAKEDDKDFTPYSLIEQLVNCYVISTKYVPRPVILSRETKVVVFSNHAPDFTMITKAKIKLVEIPIRVYEQYGSDDN